MAESRSERAAVVAVRFLGSPLYIATANIFFFGWITLQATLGIHAFDVYPYILLNLCLSYGSFFAQPLILLASNRSERLLQALLSRIEAALDSIQTVLDSIQKVLKAILSLSEGHQNLLNRLEQSQEQNLQLERYQLDILKTLKALAEKAQRDDDTRAEEDDH